MGAMPAYSYPQPRRAPERPPRPHVRVVPGQRPRTAPSALPSSVISAARMVAVALVVVAIVAIGRVALTSAAVSASIESQTISNNIDAARSAGNDLEVTQSSLSNPVRIKAEAGSLKMAAPDAVTTIDLDQDVVATDDEGNLSLAKSLAVVADAGE